MQVSSQGQGNPCCLHATLNKQPMAEAIGLQVFIPPAGKKQLTVAAWEANRK